MPFTLAWHDTDVLNGAAFWRFAYLIDFLQALCAAKRLRAKLPKHVRENLDRILCTCCPAIVQPREMHETAKVRRERKNPNRNRNLTITLTPWPSLHNPSPHNPNPVAPTLALTPSKGAEGAQEEGAGPERRGDGDLQLDGGARVLPLASVLT